MISVRSWVTLKAYERENLVRVPIYVSVITFANRFAENILRKKNSNFDVKFFSFELYFLFHRYLQAILSKSVCHDKIGLHSHLHSIYEAHFLAISHVKKWKECVKCVEAQK